MLQLWSIWHPDCLQAQNFQGLPFCTHCLRQIILDYGAREDQRRREEWKAYHIQLLHTWKERAMNAVGLTSAVGVVIGGTMAVVAGAAAVFARGAVVAAVCGRSSSQAALMGQRENEAEVLPPPGPPPLDPPVADSPGTTAAHDDATPTAAPSAAAAAAVAAAPTVDLLGLTVTSSSTTMAPSLYGLARTSELSFC